MTDKYDPAAINAATDLAALVARYVPLKTMGNEFVGRCAWHSPDENPSMYVVPGKGFVHCFSCGEHADAIGFLQQVEGVDFKEACKRLTNGSGSLPPEGVIPKYELKKKPERQTFPPPDNVAPPDMTLGRLGAPVKTWAYRTAEGKVIGYVARYEVERGKKEIRCWSWGCRSDADPTRWECGHFSKPRPLYGLDRLVDGKQVLLVEGEKSADAAATLLPNLSALTWPGGAMAVRHADWSALAGRSVVIWPDADDAGKEATKHLVTALRKAGASKIKVIDVSTITINGVETQAPDGWDAGDAKESAWTREEAWNWAKGRVGPDLINEPDEPEEQSQSQVESSTSAPQGESAAVAVTAPANATNEDSGNVESPGVSLPFSSTDSAPVTAGTTEEAPPPFDGTEGLLAEKPDNVVAIKLKKGATIKVKVPPRYRQQSGGGAGNTVPKENEEAEALPPAYSQDALARELVDKVGEDWRYTAMKNQWFKWSGSTWKAEHTKGIFEEARAVCCAAADNMELSASMRRDLASRSTAASVVVMAEWDRRIAVPVDAWDTNKWLLGTPGGVVDLKTGSMIEASREQLITMSTSVTPEPGEPTVFLRCLNEWCGGDESLISYIQRLCGYILTGETREQMLAFIHGPAKAGKGTLIKHIAAVMGDYACSAEMDTFTESKMERHSSELARLRGRRLVYAAETEEGRRWAEARIKKLSGEDRITARNLYENPEEFTPEFKLVIHGNYAPHLRNPDEAIARRMHIIPFVHPVSEENRDRKLDEKITPEHGRILSWMIAGCSAWADSGLGLPEAVSDAVTRYMDSEDTFGDWLTECIERKADGRERSADLYKSYRAFIETRGESPVSQKRFSPKLEERGFRKIKTMGVRMFEGGVLKLILESGNSQARNYQDN